MRYFKFLSDEKGNIHFFSKYLKKKNEVSKWESKLKRVLSEEEILDTDLKDFIQKMNFYQSTEICKDTSKIKIYENQNYRFFEITNSNELNYLVAEEILEKIRDKNNTEYIIVKRGS